MKNVPLLLGTLVISILLIVGIAVLFSKPTASDPGASFDQTLLTEGASVIVGPESAPVTIVEFSDFQCPACKSAEPIIQSALAQNPDSVRLVYRYFPLEQLHQYARISAQAAQAAQLEGHFSEYSQMLFDRQDTWVALDSVDQVKTTLSEYAAELGIDSASFLERMESEEVVAAVQNDINLGNQLKISATPTIFVNGVQTPAPQLLTAVQNILKQ
ncbi:thioredoxin domain-containing protein [Candidatus Woesebacteria bacterium]|nr:thioredoxin domain-containing protein [Candidatus Woesebacteria bacterium]